MDSSITYGRDYTSQVYSKYSNKYYDPYSSSSSSTDGNYLDFDQYLQLLVAQMQNQDFNDPMSDSEVLAQMAQYSMLEGIKNMTQQANISYSMSLVGKVVTVSLGQGYITGKVDSVVINNGEVALIIGGTAFSASAITDVVDTDAYNELKELIGKTVKTNTVNEEDSIKGKVQDVLFLYGDGYVVINGTVYPARYVSVVEDDETDAVPEVGEGEDGSDVPEVDGDEGEESGTVPEVGEDSGDQDSESAGTENVAMTNGYVVDKSQSYLARSQSLTSILMKELDRVGKSSAARETAENDDEEYFLQTAQVQVQDYRALLVNDEELLELGIVIAQPVTRTSTSTGTNISEVYGNDSETVYTATVGETAYGNRTSTVNYTSNVGTASSGSYTGVTTEPSVSTGDCVPHRISVEDYPAEAALADSYGTRMYDIRFIHNTGITSRILTDRVIGYTSGGAAVTEIGYSGVGQLGEVVTFKDGTQRVEILLKNGHSGWLTTSGNYTLDEICNKNAEPGSLTGKLTPDEVAIRHYSDPFSEIDTTAVGMGLLSQLGASGTA